MSASFDIKAKEQLLADICRRYSVRELLLFGSVLRPDFRPDSDVDVLVEFLPGTPVGLVHFNKLKFELEGLLGRKVDLVPKRGLKPALRESVLRNTELLYAG